MKKIEELAKMARGALPKSEEDWSSERQVQAENAFFRAVEEELRDGKGAWRSLETWCSRASCEERIKEALRKIVDHRLAIMTEYYELWRVENDLEWLGSADEHLTDSRLKKTEILFLKEFSLLWETTQFGAV